MNWYKIAKPLLENNPSGLSYLDVGHYGTGKRYLWAIEKGFIFKKIQVASAADIHTNWLDDGFWHDRGFALGRYNRGKVSIQLRPLVFDSPSSQTIINKIISILDREFNNPKIMRF